MTGSISRPIQRPQTSNLNQPIALFNLPSRRHALHKKSDLPPPPFFGGDEEQFADELELGMSQLLYTGEASRPLSVSIRITRDLRPTGSPNLPVGFLFSVSSFQLFIVGLSGQKRKPSGWGVATGLWGYDRSNIGHPVALTELSPAYAPS